MTTAQASLVTMQIKLTVILIFFNSKEVLEIFLFYVQWVNMKVGVLDIHSKLGILDDPLKEVHLTQLNEANNLRVLAEILAAHIEAIGHISGSDCASMSRPSK